MVEVDNAAFERDVVGGEQGWDGAVICVSVTRLKVLTNQYIADIVIYGTSLCVYPLLLEHCSSRASIRKSLCQLHHHTVVHGMLPDIFLQQMSIPCSHSKFRMQDLELRTLLGAMRGMSIAQRVSPWLIPVLNVYNLGQVSLISRWWYARLQIGPREGSATH